MRALKLASCMAENTEDFCCAVAGFIENRIRISTRYVSGIRWQQRERLFDGDAKRRKFRSLSAHSR